MTEGGSGLPSSLASCGLGSNRSRWLGAPAMNRWMTRFTFGAKCGFRGASGFVSGRAARAVQASVSSPARAILPSPTPQSWKKCRRVMASAGFMVSSPGDRLVEVEQGPRQGRPGRPLVDVPGPHPGDGGGVELLALEAIFLGFEEA